VATTCNCAHSAVNARRGDVNTRPSRRQHPLSTPGVNARTVFDPPSLTAG
jgi:hypothetical protein